jgi:hypothetical protein
MIKTQTLLFEEMRILQGQQNDRYNHRHVT